MTLAAPEDGEERSGLRPDADRHPAAADPGPDRRTGRVPPGAHTGELSDPIDMRVLASRSPAGHVPPRPTAGRQRRRERLTATAGSCGVDVPPVGHGGHRRGRDRAVWSAGLVGIALRRSVPRAAWSPPAGRETSGGGRQRERATGDDRLDVGAHSVATLARSSSRQVAGAGARTEQGQRTLS